MSIYTPSKTILHRYANVLVNFALNSGQGIKKGDVVRLAVPESAKPMLVELRNAVLRAGGQPLINYQPDDIAREFFELASTEQLEFFPKKYFKGLIDQADHVIHIISDTDLHELEGIDPKKILLRSNSMKPLRDWQDAKENAGKFSWTLAMYGTPAMAKEANMSLQAYWSQITKACFLNLADPVAKWKKVDREIARLKKKLDDLRIAKLHIEAKGIDLWIKLGPNRKWLGGPDRNIPSFEVFISPDWRGTDGNIEFNQPLYRYGTKIEGIKLKFKAGRVVASSATKNYPVLKEMLAAKDADKVGEFSLTDKRLSPINKIMAETLFDENMSGPYGNTHIAMGKSYQDAYPGNVAKVTKSGWAKMGYNSSVVHSDIISTANRIVTAVLADGTKKIIYRDGEFVL